MSTRRVRRRRFAKGQVPRGDFRASGHCSGRRRSVGCAALGAMQPKEVEGVELHALMVQRVRRGTLVLDCRGSPIRGGLGACFTTLKEGGIEHRRTHLANALALGRACDRIAMRLRPVIAVNVNAVDLAAITALEKFFTVILCDGGSDLRARNICVVVGALLVTYATVICHHSNALPLRNFDELAWMPTPCVACGVEDDLIRGDVSGSTPELGAAILRPSYALFRRAIVAFCDEPGQGEEDIAWRVLVSVLAEEKVCFLPCKYFLPPNAFDARVEARTPYADPAILIGQRSLDGAAHAVWQVCYDEAQRIVGGERL